MKSTTISTKMTHDSIDNSMLVQQGRKGERFTYFLVAQYLNLHAKKSAKIPEVTRSEYLLRMKGCYFLFSILIIS